MGVYPRTVFQKIGELHVGVKTINMMKRRAAISLLIGAVSVRGAVPNPPALCWSSFMPLANTNKIAINISLLRGSTFRGLNNQRGRHAGTVSVLSSLRTLSDNISCAF